MWRGAVEDMNAGMLETSRNGRLESLVETLEQADEGGLKLDTMVSYAVAVADLRAETLRSVAMENGISWEVASELMDDRPPPFTRSLDSPVPGENIILAVYSERRGRWAAVQRAADGQEHLAWAATEALARRAAALKAFAAWPVAVRPAQSDDPSSAIEPNDGTATDAGWRIKF